MRGIAPPAGMLRPMTMVQGRAMRRVRFWRALTSYGLPLLALMALVAAMAVLGWSRYRFGWVLAGAGLGAGVLVARGIWNFRERRLFGEVLELDWCACPGCVHDLTALPASVGVCPECGMRVTVREARSAWMDLFAEGAEPLDHSETDLDEFV